MVRSHVYPSYLGLAEIYYQWNDLPQVLSLADQAVRFADQWGYVEMRVLTRLRRALALLARGEANSAAEMVQQSDEILAQNQHTGDQAGFVSAYRLNYLLRSAQLEQAAQMAGDLPAEEIELSPRDVPVCLVQVKIQLAQAAAGGAVRLGQIRGLLAKIEALFKQNGQRAFLVETFIAQALVADRLGQRPTALNRMADAVDLAARESILRSFLDFGAPLPALLYIALPGSQHPAFIQRLLQAFQEEVSPEQANPVLSNERPLAPSPTGNAGLEEPLTEREQEVLRLVVEGLSNQQIAERLVIAPGTVKRHLHNIFEKLAVSTRPQAIALARKLNLA